MCVLSTTAPGAREPDTHGRMSPLIKAGGFPRLPGGNFIDANHLWHYIFLNIKHNCP